MTTDTTCNTHVRIAKKFVGTVDILLSHRRAGKVNATSKVRDASWYRPRVRNNYLLDDVAVIIGIEIGLKKAILQIHLVEYLSKSRIIVDSQCVGRGTGQSQHDEE